MQSRTNSRLGAANELLNRPEPSFWLEEGDQVATLNSRNDATIRSCSSKSRNLLLHYRGEPRNYDSRAGVTIAPMVCLRFGLIILSPDGISTGNDDNVPITSSRGRFFSLYFCTKPKIRAARLSIRQSHS